MKPFLNRSKGASSMPHEKMLLLVILVFVLLLSLATKGRFIQPDNIVDMLAGYAASGIMASGVLMILISGGLDMSFMAMATVSQYIMMSVAIQLGGNMLTTFLIGCAVGGVLGLLNAILVYNLNAPSIIITIATMNVFYGLLMWVSKGKWLYNFPDWFRGHSSLAIRGFPLAMLALVTLLSWWILNRTHIGRRIFAVGGNMEAAKRVGINALTTLIFVYVYMGITSALGAGVQAYIVQSVAPNSLMGREMQVIAIVVLGGASLQGGKGSILGNVLGLLLFAIISNGLVLLGVSSYYHDLFIGAVVLASFCAALLRGFRKKSSEGGTV